MTSRDPQAAPNEEVPAFSADFPERVLQAADTTRRRRRLGVSAVVMVALAMVGSRLLSPARQERPTSKPPPAAATAGSLSSEDFAWLEEVGTATSTPSAVIFPEDLDSSTTRRTGDDLLVAEAESI